MKQLRLIGSLLLVLLVGVVLFAACYWTASRARVAAGNRQLDELAWLVREFRLSDPELTRIRALHDGYRPGCEEMCARLAAKNRDLAAALNGATNVGPEVVSQLAEAAALRAECQTRMLRHFLEVARTMPVEPGARYLVEMQRLTLGPPGGLEDVMTHPIHEHP